MAGYDAWSAGSARRNLDAELPLERSDIVLPQPDAVGARPGLRFLDICCGPGHATAEAAARGLSVVGVDFAPATVAARRMFPTP